MPHQHEALLIESSQSHCPVTSAIRADPAFCSAFESRGALHHPRLVLPWLHWGSTFWTSSVVVVVIQEGWGSFQNVPYFVLSFPA